MRINILFVVQLKHYMMIIKKSSVIRGWKVPQCPFNDDIYLKLDKEVKPNETKDIQD